jgi:hypothetical protein
MNIIYRIFCVGIDSTVIGQIILSYVILRLCLRILTLVFPDKKKFLLIYKLENILYELTPSFVLVILSVSLLYEIVIVADMSRFCLLRYIIFDNFAVSFCYANVILMTDFFCNIFNLFTSKTHNFYKYFDTLIMRLSFIITFVFIIRCFSLIAGFGRLQPHNLWEYYITPLAVASISFGIAFLFKFTISIVQIFKERQNETKSFTDKII